MAGVSDLGIGARKRITSDLGLNRTLSLGFVENKNSKKLSIATT